MDSIYSTFFGTMMGFDNRGEVVGRDTVGDYTIDTCYTMDQGWETAAWKGNGKIIIVGRYATKEEARKGHEDWCAVCATNPISAWSVQIDDYVNF
jgi:hypothetical protein